MTQSLTAMPLRSVVFGGFALFVLYSSLSDIIEEFGNGESLFEMFDDVSLFTISVVLLFWFCKDYLAQQRALQELDGQLKSMRGKLSQIDADSSKIARQYRSVIQKQFEHWKLSPGEQDIAIALIKGLSFREVAELRNTREKTVRQQAAAVYRKAGLSGRHELAGWFFEDLLNPEPAPTHHTD
ncbi:MAG: hypothetical protein AAF404_15355 [Pseudomonadota bacterium]